MKKHHIEKKYLSIAGFTIECVFYETQYQQVRNLFLSQFKKIYGRLTFLESSKSDFRINIIDNSGMINVKLKDMNFIEYYQVKKNNLSEISTFYSISIFQFSHLVKFILFELLKGNGFYLHGATIIIEKQAVLLLGDSGIGKSTTVSLLRHNSLPFTDDLIVIRKIKKSFYCFQSHFIDKQVWIKKQPQGYPIKTVFFLKQANNTYTRKISSLTSQEEILKHLVSDKDTYYDFAKIVLNFIQSINNRSWYLFSNKNEEKLFVKIKELI